MFSQVKQCSFLSFWTGITYRSSLYVDTWRSPTVANTLTALTHSSYSSVNIPTRRCKCKRVVTVVDRHCLE